MKIFVVRSYVLALTSIALVGGCYSTESYRQAQHAALDERYPTDSLRKEVLAKYGKPRSAVVLAESPNAIDVRAHEMLKSMPPETKDLVKRYDVYWVSWAHPSHSSMSSRVYADYVFYGNNGHIVRKYRVFID